MRGLWQTLSDRDWDGLADYLTDDCLYIDVPTGPSLAAKGPTDIVKRLRVGLADLASYVNHEGMLVADGDAVIYEHSETWTFVSGEVVELAFCSVHRVREGKVALWKDYWDFAAVADHAPPGWIDGLASADMSWIHDATGEV